MRAARLYRRALQLLGARGELPRTPAREQARDQARLELDQRGLRGFLRRRQLALRVLGAVGLLAAIAMLLMHWLEPDLAEGKPWVASSAWGDFPISGVMKGEARIDGRFHTVDSDRPWFRLDLGRVYSVHAVKVHNRTNCCRERALPLVIEVSVDGKTYHRVGYRRMLFDTYTQRFPSRPARYVRLRVDRRSVLHLLRVSVY